MTPVEISFPPGKTSGQLRAVNGLEAMERWRLTSETEGARILALDIKDLKRSEFLVDLFARIA